MPQLDGALAALCSKRVNCERTGQTTLVGRTAFGQAKEGDVAANGSAAAADVGVLFVHGIGEQQSGQTVVQCAEALLDWFGRWRGGNKGQLRAARMVTVADARLKHDGDSIPAHARLSVPVQPAGAPERLSNWLVAESWWAGTYQSPTYRELAWWSLSVLPRVVAVHTVGQVLDAVDSVGRSDDKLPVIDRLGDIMWHLAHVVWLMLALFLWLLLLPVAIALVLLILLVGLLPLRSVRSLVVRVQNILTGSVGDSYVFVNRPLRAAAALSRVRSDLEWLRKRCGKVVVVAHSQGAAVTHDLLRTGGAAPVEALFTYGSGLNKLTLIRLSRYGRFADGLPWQPHAGAALIVASSLGVVESLREAPSTFLSSLGIAVALIVGAGVIGALAERSSGGIMRSVAKGTAMALGTGALLSIVYAAWEVGTPLGWLTVLLFAGVGLVVAGLDDARQAITFDHADVELSGTPHWVDVYSTADPVPNGPLALRSREQHVAESIEIANLSSFLLDHTSYWRNPDGFVSLVVAKILDWGVGAQAAKDVLGADYGRRFRRARYARLRRVRYLAILRVLLLAAGGVTLWRLWESFTVTSPVVTSALNVVAAVPGIGELQLSGARGVWVAHALGTAVVVLGVVAATVIAELLWKLWDSTEINAFFTDRDLPYWPVPARITVLGWGFLLNVWVIVALEVTDRAIAVSAAAATVGLIVSGLAVNRIWWQAVFVVVRRWWAQLRNQPMPPGRELKDAVVLGLFVQWTVVGWLTALPVFALSVRLRGHNEWWELVLTSGPVALAAAALVGAAMAIYGRARRRSDAAMTTIAAPQ